jgi:hypothetical protein
VAKATLLRTFKIGATEVIESSRPNLRANYLEVSFSKSKLPNTVPKVLATVEIIPTKCGTLSYLSAKQSKEMSWRLIKNIDPIRMKAKKCAFSN